MVCGPSDYGAIKHIQDKGQEAHPLWRQLFQHKEKVSFKFIFDGETLPSVNIYRKDGTFIGGLFFEEEDIQQIYRWMCSIIDGKKYPA